MIVALITEMILFRRHKRKLLPKQNDPWKPETAKKAHTALKRTSICSKSWVNVCCFIELCFTFIC